MLHKLPKYLVWIGAFLFVAMFPVGELCAQNNLETLTNKDLFAYLPKSSLRATRWLCKADKFKAEGNVEKAVLYYTKAAEKGPCAVCPEFVLQRRIWSQPRRRTFDALAIPLGGARICLGAEFSGCGIYLS